MFVVFRWWCPYTTGPSPATRICASATAGINSRMVSPIPVNKRLMKPPWPPSLHDFAFLMRGCARYIGDKRRPTPSPEAIPFASEIVYNPAPVRGSQPAGLGRTHSKNGGDNDEIDLGN